jgi:2'-5' RNA ligase
VPGHTVLQLPVPPLEDWVVARTRDYDAAFVSDDPRFAHAHVTALGPFDPEPSPAALAVVAGIAARTAPMTVRLGRLGQFPNGIIHLLPEPDEGLRRLTATLAEAFPEHPPYGGRFGLDVVPHVTLDAAAPEVTIVSTRRLLGEIVPVTVRLDKLQLAWWESGRCHVQHEWFLGG